MEWTDDRIIELLRLLRTEPCIWNPKHRNYSNKILVNDAWIRIRDNFSSHCSLEGLKKKKNSLFLRYRDCLKKIKESKQEAENLIYKPDWFAFKIMNNFLARAYEVDYEAEAAFKEKQNPPQLDPPLGKTEDLDDDEPPFAALIADPKFIINPITHLTKRQQKKMRNKINSAQKLVDQVTDNPEKSNSSKQDESDLFGLLLAHKLKLLEVDERLRLMNDIDNHVYKYMTSVREWKASDKKIEDIFKN